MADVNEAVQCVTARVAEGSDVMAAGDPAVVRQLLSAAALEPFGQVVPVVAETGELSLSSLIAQLSGETDLGGQDDAVLELGFRRLTGPGRTILVVQAPAGIGRSALRYLQHMARLAPRLSLVVSGSAALDTLLAEPGFAALRTRLEAVPAVQVAEVPPATMPLVELAPRKRRVPALWMASAVAAAAVAGVAWFGFGAPRAVSPAFAGVPVQFASIPAPLPALMAGSPARVDAPPPVLASVEMPPLAAKPAVALADQPALPRDVAATLPPLIARQHPVLAAAVPLPPLLKAAPALRSHRPEPRTETARTETARTENARLARRYPEWQAPARYDDPPAYAYEPPYPEPVQDWRRYEPRRRETPYLGTFAVDPYGMRVFRYDP